MTREQLWDFLETSGKLISKTREMQEIMKRKFIETNAKFKPGDKVLFRKTNDKIKLFVKDFAQCNEFWDIRYILVYPEKDNTPGNKIFSSYGTRESELTLIERKA